MVPKGGRWGGCTGLRSSSCACRREPMSALKEPSRFMLELNCRWIDRLTLLVSGRRVVSLPWNHDTLDPFETEGFTNGGAVHGGIPWLNKYVGRSPLLWLGNVWVSVKPMLWVDPVTDMSWPNSRPHYPRITVLSCHE